MGRKKIFKPGYTCKNPDCRKELQHKLEFDISADVRQNIDSTDLLRLRVLGLSICPRCGEETAVGGILSKFDNGLPYLAPEDIMHFYLIWEKEHPDELVVHVWAHCEERAFELVRLEEFFVLSEKLEIKEILSSDFGERVIRA